MDNVVEILSQRRIWVGLIPLAIAAGKLAGVELTDDLLVDTGDKVVTGSMALLALWSYVKPKQ